MSDLQEIHKQAADIAAEIGTLYEMIQKTEELTREEKEIFYEKFPIGNPLDRWCEFLEEIFHQDTHARMGAILVEGRKAVREMDSEEFNEKYF